MRRTCTTRTFLVRVVQTSSLNASSSQAHGPPSTALLIGHDDDRWILFTRAEKEKCQPS
jgi:hypothetical protein